MRRRPIQDRSQASVERMLHAAAEILAERGIEGLSTNAVAARAGVNIATLYAYFDDKFALLLELFDRFERQRLEFLVDQLDTLASTQDTDAWVEATVSGLARFRVEVPAASDLRSAVASVPELRARDRASDVAAATTLADALCRRRPDLDPSIAHAAAFTFIVSGTAVLDRACVAGAIDDDITAALVAMFQVRLRDLLGDEPA